MEELEASLQRERESLEEEIRKNTRIMGENRSLREEMERSVFPNNLSRAHQQAKTVCWCFIRQLMLPPAG